MRRGLSACLGALLLGACESAGGGAGAASAAQTQSPETEAEPGATASADVDQQSAEWQPLPSSREWTRTFGGTAGDSPFHLVVRESGIAIGGSTWQELGTQGLGPAEVWTQGAWPAFVASLELDGSVLWGTQTQGEDPDRELYVQIVQVAPLPGGDVVKVIEIVPFGAALADPARVGTFLRRLDSAGQHAWTVEIAGGGSSEFAIGSGTRLAAMSDGSFALVSLQKVDEEPRPGMLEIYSGDGQVSASLDLAPYSDAIIATTHDDDVLLAWTLDDYSGLCLERFTPALERRWAACMATKGWSFIRLPNDGLVDLSSGRIGLVAAPVAGAGAEALRLDTEREDSLVVQPPPDAPPTYPSSLVAVFEANGEPAWGQAFAAKHSSSPVAVTEASDGSLFVGGAFVGTSELLGVTDASVQGGSYVAKFSPDGEYLGAKLWDVNLYSVLAAPDDTLVASGSFGAPADFGRGDHEDWRSPLGTTDGFVMRFEWSTDNRVPGRVPAHCDTLAGSPLPQDFAECEAAGFGVREYLVDPTCVATWCDDDPLYDVCRALGGGVTVSETSPAYSCCDVHYPLYQCPCLGNACD